MNLRTFFGLCTHKWKVIKTVDIYWEENDKLPYKDLYVLQCEKCGTITSNYVGV